MLSESQGRAPADSEGATRDLQDRVARFARATFVISGVMLVASTVTDLASGADWGGVSRAGRAVHLGAQVPSDGHAATMAIDLKHRHVGGTRLRA